VQPEDFVVEEVPLYQAAGEGDFVFLFVESRGMSTLDKVAVFRKHFGLQDHEVGLAGWKDKQAVSRQWISLPRKKVTAGGLSELERHGIIVLAQKYHGHKLRTGHLRGNNFKVLIRGAAPDSLPRARQVIDRLRAAGMPNFYGPQRFGAGGRNAEDGLAILVGRKRLRSARQRRLLISAATSLLFNLTLKERLQQQLFNRVLLGDIAKKHDTGGLFTVTEPEVEQPRAERLEISPTGPIWGKKMRRAQGVPGTLEEEILRRAGLQPQIFNRQPGSRRVFRIPLGEVELQQEKEGLRLSFFLPKGSYATVLLSEVMKP